MKVFHVAQKKKHSGGSWKNERASVSKKNTTKPKSNKYRPSSESSKRPEAGSAERHWRAGYTRKDGTKVQGHYVNKSTGK